MASEWNQTELKRYNKIRFQLQLVNGVVTRNYKTQPFPNLQTDIIAPKVMYRDLLCQAHDDAGHQGTERTLSHLKDLAYWVNMSSDVNEYVRSCQKTCQKAKLSVPTKAPLINTPIGRTMQPLQVDVLEVPVSSKGNRYLLVVEDLFKKWLECYPMCNQKSETITEILVEIFSRYGIPEFLHSDQGRNFESQLLKETCRALGIRYTHTALHPQGNALVERSNRTVLQMLRCYVERNEDWEKYLQLVLFAYRTSKHSSTGVSSFQLMYGRESHTISYLPPLPGYEQTSYECSLSRKLFEIREFVEGQLIEAQRRQKEYYDRNSNLSDSMRFKVGLGFYSSCGSS